MSWTSTTRRTTRVIAASIRIIAVFVIRQSLAFEAGGMCCRRCMVFRHRSRKFDSRLILCAGVISCVFTRLVNKYILSETDDAQLLKSSKSVIASRAPEILLWK